MTRIPTRAFWRASIATLMLLPLAGAHAQTRSLIFERAEIRIDSPPIDEKDKNPKPPHAPMRLDVEVRGEDALALEYIHTLNTLNPGSGVMIVFDIPSIVSVPAMKVYTPVDVLFVADDGTLLQIVPSVTLGEIAQNVKAKGPIKALLFIKSGEALARGLHPRDMVVGSMFTPPVPTQE